MNKSPPSAVDRNVHGNISQNNLSPQHLLLPSGRVRSPPGKSTLTAQTSSSATDRTVDSSALDASIVRRGSFLLSMAAQQSDIGRRESLKAGVVTAESAGQVPMTSPDRGERIDTRGFTERIPVTKPRARSPWKLWKLGHS